jgi:two-component system, response regulator, stage 0 sporulation protein F
MRSECGEATAVVGERVRGRRGSTSQVRGEAVATKPRPKAPLVLLADDDFEMRRLMAGALRAMGYRVAEFDDGVKLRDYIAYLREARRLLDIDLIISDILMPGASGFEVLVSLGALRSTIPFIAITAFGDDNTHAAAHALGAAAMFDKPFELEELKALAARLAPPARVASQGN